MQRRGDSTKGKQWYLYEARLGNPIRAVPGKHARELACYKGDWRRRAR